MSSYETLMVYVTTNDRLMFLRFRHHYVRKHGYDKWKELLDKVLEETKTQ